MPSTAQGKAISSMNALKHGLTARSPLLPSEDPAEFQAFIDAQLRRWNPETPDFRAAVLEFAGISWRLNRVAVQEAKLIDLELKRIQIDRRTDHALDQLLRAIGEHDQETLEALALDRLLKSRTLVNLHRQEGRLERRLKHLREEVKHFAVLANMRRLALEREAEEAQEAEQQRAAAAEAAGQQNEPVDSARVVEMPLRN